MVTLKLKLKGSTWFLKKDKTEEKGDKDRQDKIETRDFGSMRVERHTQKET